MSISLEDFNNNFRVIVKALNVPHIDDEGTFPAAIGFYVICDANSRVNFYEYHFTDQGLVNFLDNHGLLDYAWQELKSDISAWATSIVNEPSLIGYNYDASGGFNNTYPYLTFSDFTSNFTVTVNRFEINPSTNPTNWYVAFIVKNNTNSMVNFFDAHIYYETFAVARIEQEILDDGWNMIKDNIASWANDIMKSQSLIDSQYTVYDI